SASLILVGTLGAGDTDLQHYQSYGNPRHGHNIMNGQAAITTRRSAYACFADLRAVFLTVFFTVFLATVFLVSFFAVLRAAGFLAVFLAVDFFAFFFTPPAAFYASLLRLMSIACAREYCWISLNFPDLSRTA